VNAPTHRRPSPARGRTSAAVVIYIVVLVSFQVFLITVAAQAFLDDDEGLAWTTAGVSVALAVAAVALLRYLRP